MKVINVELTVKPGQQAAYEAFIAKLVAGSRSEAGNISYDHFKKVDQDNEYEIVEHWRDADAIAFHNDTPHFQAFLAGVDDYLVKPLVIIRMDYDAS